MSKAISALALRRRRIEVPVPGSDAVIVCRKPDLLSQVVRGLLPQPLVDAVMKRAVDGSFDAGDVTVLGQSGEFIDRWVCLAAVTPRIVLTEAEAGDDAVWIDDLDLTLKLAIFHATVGTNAPVDPAVTEFRDGESGGTAAGPDRAAVPDAPVDVVTH